jgi:hypothetical protein
LLPSLKPQTNGSGTNRVEFPGEVSVYVERDIDPQLLRAVVEMLRA